MNNIWANRLIAGTKVWDEVTDNRRAGVKAVLLDRVEKGLITAEKYAGITGEGLEAANEAGNEVVNEE